MLPPQPTHARKLAELPESWRSLMRSHFPLRTHFHASRTMFVFLKGHHLIEYYFAVVDARCAANDFESAEDH